jgi:endonuclease-3
MIGITPKNLSEAPIGLITEAIRPAGLYNKRSRIIKTVSKEVKERFNGSLEEVMKKPYPQAREDLINLPGVGPKTADVVLLFSAGLNIIPVDRHIFRISERLGIVPNGASYNLVKDTWENVSPPQSRENIHVYLIQFGREVCKAQKPRCFICFIKDLCNYSKKELKE